jgi:hypothetical protein
MPAPDRLAALAGALGAVGLLATACGGGGDRAAQFCAEVRADQPVITAGVQGSVEVGDVVGRFRSLEGKAPLAIEEDWSVLTELVETAAAIEPTDPEARNRLVSAAYEADLSVQHVVGWVKAVCGVDLTAGSATGAPATTAARRTPATTAAPSKPPATTAAAKPPATTATPATTAAASRPSATTVATTKAGG